MHKSFLRSFIIAVVAALAVMISPRAAAQALVSTTLTGTVTDAAGKVVAGANVTVVHTPTNARFKAVSGPNGRFAVNGLPVGGPFAVSATANGYTIDSIADVQTTLGENTEVQLLARPSSEDVLKLEKLSVSAGVNDLSADQTGASSVLSNRRILAQPTVNRSFTDLIKTNPFVSVRGYPQVEALGMNYRYNTITLDGAKINDSFGLASSGLFSAFNPFSLDAIEQFSVSLTPYDGRQSGFAGASINAVSKSGTNELHGSSYFIFTDAAMQGPDEFGPNIHKRTPLKERTYGFTLGGPIWKDHLFFFLNFEKFIQDTAPTLPGFTPDPAFLTAVQAKASTLPGNPNIGTFGGSATSRKADFKRMAKIDWQISADHRLSVRYSDTTSDQPNFGSFNYTSFSQPAAIAGQPSSFTNGGTGTASSFYNLHIAEKVWAAQLFSNWTPDLHTEIDYSNTKQDSVRAVPIAFPEIRIFNVPGTATTGGSITGNDAFRFGSEISSQGNELHVKTQTATASGDYNWRTFTFSAGADWESSDYLNLFRQGSYGYFDYTNLAAFQADTPFGFARAVVQNTVPAADISKFKRTGVFVQAKWEPIARLNLTVALRDDFVGSPIAPPENADFKSKFGMTNAGTVDGTSTPQPRFSFNYALDDKRTTQIRGGTGVFLGRNPWVWISNSYGNTGVGRYNVVATGAATPTLTQYLSGTYTNTDSAYKFDPANPIGSSANGPSASTVSSINLIKPGMRLPTIQRSNLAVDHKLPWWDTVLSIEYIDTRQLSALFVDNMNLKPTVLGADGRQRFAGTSTNAPIVPGYGNVIRTRAIHEGKSDYASISLNRDFKNHWAYSVSYTRGRALDTQGLGSSTANSQWQFNNVFNQNAVEVARSDYEIKDRVQIFVSREFKYFHDLQTTVSLAYEGRTGQPYSFVYSGDLNGDGFSTNDLVAVPRDSSDSRFDFSAMTTAQQTAYFKFLHDSGLSQYGGGYAPRNAFFTPWQNRLDLDFRQELPVYSGWGKHVRMELFLDFINFGSWLDKHVFNYVEEINTSTTNSSQIRALGNASYNGTGAGALIKPTVTLNPDGSINFPSSSQITFNNADTRWKIQVGARLKF